MSSTTAKTTVGIEAKQSFDRSLEADSRHVEHGVVGWTENDESHFDKRNSVITATESDDDGDERMTFSEKLYGRQEELDKLREIFQLASAPQEGSLQTVFLNGFSGSGKTSLIHQMAKDAQTQSSNKFSNLLIEGKYDQLRAPIPYRGLTEGLKRWYRSLTSEERQALGKDMQADLGTRLGEDSMERLADLLPAFSKILTGFDNGDDSTQQISARSQSQSTARQLVQEGNDSFNKTRIQHAIYTLLQFVNEKTTSSPLILFLDDLQWADTNTLSFLEYMLLGQHDRKLNKFVLIGSYRTNEVTSDHSFQKLMDKLSTNPNSETSTCFHSLALKDLTQVDVGHFIADTLDLNTDAVEPLAQAVFEKTLGNMFFVRQALEELVRKHALYFDLVTFSWQWSDQSLARSLEGIDVWGMVKSKIQALPNGLQRMLVVASFAKPIFDLYVLLGLLHSTVSTAIVPFEKEEHVAASFTSQTLSPLLRQAVDDGLFVQIVEKGSKRPSVDREKGGSVPFSTEYAFAHDRFREAAKSLLPEALSDEFLVQVGNAMVEMGLHEGQIIEDEIFFLGVHHLNLVQKGHDDKLRIAKLNLAAAEESMVKAAFENAAEFAQRGISYLSDNGGNDCWLSDRELTQALYSLAAEASRASGDHATAVTYCNTCLDAQRDRPLAEKIEIYYTLANGLFYGGDRYEEAKSILLKLLEHHDCHFPVGKASRASKMAKELLSIKLFQRQWPPDLIDKLPFMTDVDKIQAMKLLKKLTEVCFLTKDKVLTVLVLAKAMKYTLKHGITIYAPSGIAGLSLVLAGALKDPAAASLYADYGLKLMKRVNHKPIEAATLLVAYCFGLWWTKPNKDCAKRLRRGYQVGLDTGMVESANFCLMNSNMQYFFSGQHLNEIHASYRIHVPRMEEAGHREQCIVSKGMWAVICSLRGVEKERTSIELTEVEKTNAYLIAVLGLFERIELGYLGDTEGCARSSMVNRNDIVKATNQACFDVFMSTLSCLRAFRKTKKKEYRTEVKNGLGLVSSWARKDNPNVLHWKALLDAELAACNRRTKNAEESYDAAVRIALDRGYRQDAALAYECWGQFLLDTAGAESKASQKLQEAVQLYSMWGALAKVKKLKEQYSSLLSIKPLGSAAPVQP